MNRIKVSANFFIDEFLPEDIYKQYEGNSIWFIDSRLFSLAQFVRDYFGKSNGYRIKNQ